MLGMRMAYQGGFVGRGIFGFFEQRFEASDGAGDKERFNFAGQLLG